jgi:hypothetical protein
MHAAAAADQKAAKVAALKHELEVTVVLGTDLTVLALACMLLYSAYAVQQQQGKKKKPTSQKSEMKPLVPKTNPKPTGRTKQAIVAIEVSIDEDEESSMAIDA